MIANERARTGIHALLQVLCKLPHHHALIVTVSTSSRSHQPPGSSLRCVTLHADGSFCFIHLTAFHRLPASIFQSTLTRDSTAGYATEHVHCLTDERATSTSIRQAFADISAEAGAGCSVLVVFDMPTVEIQGGPEAGFYFCPHDYRCQCCRYTPYPRTCVVLHSVTIHSRKHSNADRRSSGLHTDEIVEWAGSLRSDCCSMFITTVYIGSKLDNDAQVARACFARSCSRCMRNP